MFPMETRYKAVVHYQHFVPSLRKVARLYNVSKSSLQRWVRQAPCTRRCRRKQTVKCEVLACIRSTLAKNPMQTMESVRREVAQRCGLRLSVRSVGRAVTRAGFSFKKAFGKVGIVPDAARTLAFCAQVAEAPSSDIVWIDEAGFYVGDHATKGYAPVGRRLHCTVSRTLRRVKLTLLMAMTSSGVLHHVVLDRNCKKHDFVKFVAELPVSRGTRLVMDNLQIHKSHEAIDAMKAKGCVPVFTPPYSPRFNAIEYAFSSIKRLYRRECSELQAQHGVDLDPSDYEELLHASVLFPHDMRPFVERTLATASEASKRPTNSSLSHDS